MANYRLWITLNTSHEYFSGIGEYIALMPTVETRQLLAKLGLLFKSLGKNSWGLLIPDGFSELINEKEAYQFKFSLKNVDAGFYYYTDHENTPSESIWELQYLGKNGIWKELTLNLTKKEFVKENKIDLIIHGVKKFVEVIVIQRSANKEVLVLKEDRNQLQFSSSTIAFPGESQPVYRFVTKEPIALKEVYAYKLTLWKVLGNAEVLLSNFIPFPEASSQSIINPLNTITSYFYF
ncbi:hypothetical protein [Pedobacter sp. ASV28]|uniref:hypothetical protein n=1 Tax=Pedobacter sp. ASV28 TaxID=2795123 RepID=UPI0018ECCA1C|nr:hypothetical protein [Pedobacter sp. ASV28]